MDLATITHGIRSICRDESSFHRARKLSACDQTFKKLEKIGVVTSYDDFLSRLPDQILNTYFGSDGIDSHYTMMMSAVMLDEGPRDVIPIILLNYILQELTYQGRHLSPPRLRESFVLATGDGWCAEAATGNTDRIATIALVGQSPFADRVKQRLKAITLNQAHVNYATIENVEVHPATITSDIGCIAFLNFGEHIEDLARASRALQATAARLSADSHYLFAGDADHISELRETLSLPSDAYIVHKTYVVSRNGSLFRHAILVVANLANPLSLDTASLRTESSFTIVRNDLAFAGAVAGLERLIVRDDEVVVQKPPRIVISSAPLLDDQLTTFTSDLVIKHEAYVLPAGRIIDSRTPHNQTYVIASQDRQIVPQLHDVGILAASPYYPQPGTMEFTAPRQREASILGVCIPLSFSPYILDFHSHFLLQCFPRVQIAQELGIAETCKYLVAPSIKHYQRKMLEMVGVRSDQIVHLEQGIEYVCDKLIVPAVIPAILTAYHAKIYDKMISAVLDTNGNLPKRFIISREARSTWRNFVNFDTMCDILIDDFGFQVISPDKLSIEDEIRLFQGAEIVVGAEGAGLYNSCFMNSSADVVCLADQDYVMYVLAAMAQYRGFEISFVFGEAFQSDRDLSRKAGHADFVIDPIRVRDCVREIIEARVMK